MIKLCLVFFFTFALAHGQSDQLTGKVYDEYKVPLEGVSVINQTNQEEVKTNCQGYFALSAERGDTLVVRKSGYFNHSQVLKRTNKRKITLEFDYGSFAEALDQRTDLSTSISKGGQALFIVDREVIGLGKIDIDPKDILHVEVVKGLEAQELFGNVYSKNGVILIFTSCGYREKE